MGKRKTPPCDSGESTSLDGSGSGSGGGSCVSTPSEPPSRTTPPPESLPELDTELLKVCDAELPGLPTPKKPRLTAEERISRISAAARAILECLDDDPDREGLRKTPIRFAKSLLHLTSGYQATPEDVLGDAEFDENHSEMVLVRNIDVFSHCEHHLLPFYGRCHVSYVPNGSVIGLSKIARIVDLYARRLQVQERLTTQIADAVMRATGASGVMVYVSCTHMCMVMRGVQKVRADTVTTAARGSYKENAALRQEFLGLVVNSG